MSLWLQSLGAEVTGFSLQPPTQPSLFEEAEVADGMSSILGDIRDLVALQQAMQAARPDIIIHMAAQPLVRYSYQNPVETYSTNVMGTVHLLEAVRNTPSVKAVVNITTGPGGINALNGVFGAYTDSIPMLVLSGQVKRETCLDFVPVPGLRQLPLNDLARWILDARRIGKQSRRPSWRVAPLRRRLGESNVNEQELRAELERLRAENEQLKSRGARGISMKVSEKGAVSIYGLGRFPVTLYKEQWLKLLAMTDEIREFIKKNDSKLKTKG